MTATTARLTAGMLVVLAACAGSSSAPSPSTSGFHHRSPSTIATALANGQALPAGCPTGAALRLHGGLRRGWNAWALDAERDATCLFPRRPRDRSRGTRGEIERS